MVEQVVMRIGLIIYTRTVAGLGTLPYAVHQVCLNIQSLSFMNGQAFGYLPYRSEPRQETP